MTPESPRTVFFIQLPVPQINFGRQTANLPLAGACMLQALSGLENIRPILVPESMATYLADAALVDLICRQRPEVVCFTVYTWNVDRSIFFAAQLKQRYGPQIIFGGPEITPDNPRLKACPADVLVYGAGEEVIRELLVSGRSFSTPWINGSGSKSFANTPSVYLEIELEPWIENIVLVETQRGCPYRCRYCYYGKSHQTVVFKQIGLVTQAVAWALEHKVKELYLLDPSLDVRPDLKQLLTAIARLNKNGELQLISEIRADAVSAETARLMSEAGFHWVETGLQSTNPRALEAMGRKTDLKKFLAGIESLKKYGITPGVDLILGLPGDDPEGFRQSVEFVAANDLAEDVQVFPLSVLPGTVFRRQSERLGLIYDPNPPYSIQQTPDFSEDDLLLALDQAESRLDVAFYPLPELDLSWYDRPLSDPSQARDRVIILGGHRYISKLALARHTSLAELEAAAGRLTHPYQLLVPAGFDYQHLKQALAVLTEHNPFTPFEIVFFEPERLPPANSLLEASRLFRPHFLDNDLRFLYDKPGNRAMLFSLVTTCREHVFYGPMQRQIFWWRKENLPADKDFKDLEHLDGILIDNHPARDAARAWQDRWAPCASDLTQISFADFSLQLRWLELTSADDYWLGIFEGSYRPA